MANLHHARNWHVLVQDPLKWTSFGLVQETFDFQYVLATSYHLEKKNKIKNFLFKNNVIFWGKNQQNFTGSWDQSYADFRFGTVGIQDVY